MIPRRVTELTKRISPRAATALHVVDELGPAWVLERARMAAEHRMGLDERRSPLGSWKSYEVAGNERLEANVLDMTSARAFYRDKPGVVERLRELHHRTARREFSFFGNWQKLDSWHHDPITPAHYQSDLHWSRVPEQDDGDLKLVWEPSRFGWAIALGQLHIADPDAGAHDTFWELFEDWCENNQPNAGVNWQCGQESSIRFMAVMFATQAFEHKGLTAARQTLLAAFADATARRVFAHWRYARSQNNNHIVSEAVGLLGVAGFFPGLDVAARAQAKGDALLREACERLVFDDGGTSQYSLNYHRVFLDNFIWARTLYDRSGRPVPPELDNALDRATAFLEALTDTQTGHAPNFGQNDGARLLPTVSADLMDMRPTIAASKRVRGVEHDESELSAWFHQPDKAARNERRAQSHYPEAGITVLRTQSSRAVIRGGNFRFRPSQSDQLNVELWIDGAHVICDPGTWSYKPRGGEPDLALSRFHNGPIIDGREDMLRASRVLFVDWSMVHQPDIRAVSYYGQRQSPATGMTVERRVAAIHDGWEIDDQISISSPAEISTNWIVPTKEVTLNRASAEFVIMDRRFRLDCRADSAIELQIEPATVAASYRITTPATLITTNSGRVDSLNVHSQVIAVD